MATLKSKHFSEPRNARLEGCLNQNSQHIIWRSPPDKGDHVARIQKALIALGRATKGEFGDELDHSAYGRKTAGLVARFKAEEKIFNYRNQIDNIVGIKTLQKLDDLMWTSPEELPAVTTSPSPSPPLDIFMKFRGAFGEGRDTETEQRFKNAFNTQEYFLHHQAAVPICYKGMREQERFVNDAVAEAMRLRQENPNGVTILIGHSAGGVSALKAATLLTSAGVRLDYVAINDAAFFDADVASHKPLRYNLPGGIAAEKKENYYQTVGHELLRDRHSRTGYQQGTEYHLELAGFRNISLDANGPLRMIVFKSSAVEATAVAFAPAAHARQKALRSLASDAHTLACGFADDQIHRVVTSLIKP